MIQARSLLTVRKRNAKFLKGRLYLRESIQVWYSKAHLGRPKS